MNRQELERLTREQLIAQAERLGISRPRVLTQPELIDEIIGRTAKSEREKQKARGWLGRARDLLARVVERGLHLPEAARVLRSTPEERPWPTPPPPLPTVTLAEIYAAQGHLERAIGVLDDVLAREPDHQEARTLRTRFAEQLKARARPGRGAVPAPEPQEPAKIEAPPAKIEAPPAEIEVPPATQKAAEAAPAEAAPIEAAPAETAPIEAAPIEAAPTETAPIEAAPIEAAPTETAPIEAAPTEAAPPLAETKSDEAEATPAPAAAEEAAATAVEKAEEAVAVEETALPERYDVDEIVAIAVDPRTVYLYWEVRATTLAHARARRPDGWLGVRVVSVTANWSGPIVQIRDLRVDALYGDRFLREVEPGSNVRVSIGWLAGGDFEPIAVGIEVTVPHLAPTQAIAQESAVWEPAARPASAGQSPRAPLSGGQPPWRLPLPTAERWPHGSPRSTIGAPPPTLRRAPAAPPVDTGVEIWASPSHAPRADEIALEQVNAWFQPGGSSELGRWV